MYAQVESDDTSFYEEHFSGTENTVVGAAAKRRKGKRDKSRARSHWPKAAAGKRVDDVWIAAEGDNFNRILVSLNLYGDASRERGKLQRLNPHLPLCSSAKSNTPLKAGSRVNLTQDALKKMMPDQSVEGESGLSLSKEVYTEPKLLGKLFSAKDYLNCDDSRVSLIWEKQRCSAWASCCPALYTLVPYTVRNASGTQYLSIHLYCSDVCVTLYPTDTA